MSSPTASLSEDLVTFLLDTNVLLRAVIIDSPEQFEKSKSLFAAAKRGEINLLVTPVVIGEACFVLESFYKQPTAKIADTMEVFLSADWLLIEQREALQGMWDFYRRKMHFVDSYLLSLAKHNSYQLATFDLALSKRLTKCVP